MPRIPDYLKLTPQEAVAYFRQKVAIPTERWDQFEAEQHDFAYTIAGLTQADILEDMRWLIGQAISEGNSFETFLKQFDRLVGRKGWQPEPLPAGPADWRMRIVFETPIRRAYGAGRREQQLDPEVIKQRPYLEWIHGDSPQPRPTHLALHHKIFEATDPGLDVAYPPCAFGCKCRMLSRSRRQVERLGLKVERFPDPETIAEPGFRQAPGSTPDQDRQQVLKQGLNRLSPDLRQQVEDNLKAKGLI